jgi:hypothetical protein
VRAAQPPERNAAGHAKHAIAWGPNLLALAVSPEATRRPPQHQRAIATATDILKAARDDDFRVSSAIRWTATPAPSPRAEKLDAPAMVTAATVFFTNARHRRTAPSPVRTLPAWPAMRVEIRSRRRIGHPPEPATRERDGWRDPGKGGQNCSGREAWSPLSVRTSAKAALLNDSASAVRVCESSDWTQPG